MLTEEVLALLESRIVRANLRGVMVEVQPDILDELISEVRRLRAELERRDTEIVALRYTLEGIRGEAMSMRGVGMDASNMGYSAILITTLAENALSETAALNAKPDAAPVENAAARPCTICGQMTSRTWHESPVCQTCYEKQVPPEEWTKATAEIKVGDRVRIVKKRGILEGRLGGVVEIDGDKHVVKFPSGKSSFTCDFTRDEITPA